MWAEIGFRNIIDNNGIAIAVTGMLIVFLALLLISTFIALLPRVLERLEAVLPSENERFASPGAAPEEALDETTVAALAVALHRRRAGQPRS